MKYSEKEQKIIRQVIKGRKYTYIAEDNEMSLEALYDFLERYCQENNVMIIHHSKEKTREFIPKEKKKDKRLFKTKASESIKKIEEWCEKNQRFPRGLSDVSIGPKEEQGTDKETPEQLEKRMHTMYNNLKTRMNMKYNELIELDDIENEEDREIFSKLRKIEWTYTSKERKIVTDCKNAIELRQWCREHNRLPNNIKNVNFAKKGEEETEEQKEVRLYYVMIELEGKYLDVEVPLENKPGAREKELQLSYLLLSLRKKYSVEFVRDERKFTSVNKQQLAKAILNLLNTRKATLEEIRKIAEYYNMNLEDIFSTKFFEAGNERDD